MPDSMMILKRTLSIRNEFAIYIVLGWRLLFIAKLLSEVDCFLVDLSEKKKKKYGSSREFGCQWLIAYR